MDSVSVASAALGMQQAVATSAAAIAALKAIQEAQAQIVKIIAAAGDGRGSHIDIFV